jgi:DNA-binding NarL/FixJ family response regulator
VSGDPLVRGGLASLLAQEPDVVVAGQWPPESPAAEDADVLVWDAEEPAALDAMAAAEARGARIVAVLRDRTQSAPVLAAGARAVVGREVDAPALSAAVRAVAAGLLVLDGVAASAVLRPRPAADAPVEPLTPREQEVLRLLAEGLSNKLIGARLGISEHTAKFHVNSILGKLGAQTRAEAVAQAARLGVLLF